ncbi:MAG: MoaA/NifB/PqqE/SkfB family radical SAM enzyme [Myxococcota bacterium]|jgi:MoaA/NifB/PqqE/SkfB family radical SAM enzyme
MSLLRDAALLSTAVRSTLPGARGPFKLTVAVTWVCDQRCTHCRIWQRPRTDELTPGEWREVWRQSAATLRWIDLTGGEVTTRPDFAEIAIAAIEECPGLAMLHYPSNGRKPEILERVTRAILGAKPARLVLSISLDGPRDVHDKLRGDKGAFDNAVESYRRIRALGVEVYFGMTLSAYNLELLEPTYEALKHEVPELTWRDLHANFLHVSEHYFQNQKVKRADPVALDATIRRFMKQRGAPSHPTHALEHLYLRQVSEHLKTGRSPVPCASLTGNAFINPTGTVYPCHIWDAPVANLRDHGLSLEEVWATPEARKRRGEVKRDACPGCWTPCEAYPSLLARPLASLG